MKYICMVENTLNRHDKHLLLAIKLHVIATLPLSSTIAIYIVGTVTYDDNYTKLNVTMLVSVQSIVLVSRHAHIMPE